MVQKCANIIAPTESELHGLIYMDSFMLLFCVVLLYPLINTLCNLIRIDKEASASNKLNYQVYIFYVVSILIVTLRIIYHSANIAYYTRDNAADLVSDILNQTCFYLFCLLGFGQAMQMTEMGVTLEANRQYMMLHSERTESIDQISTYIKLKIMGKLRTLHAFAIVFFIYSTALYITSAVQRTRNQNFNSWNEVAATSLTTDVLALIGTLVLLVFLSTAMGYLIRRIKKYELKVVLKNEFRRITCTQSTFIFIYTLRIAWFILLLTVM